jgi:hypothetical protein
MAAEYSRASDDSFLTPITTFEHCREATRPDDRLRSVRRAAEAFHDQMKSTPEVDFFKTVTLARVPYPTRYALLNACSTPTPYLHIVNRLFIVQVKHRGVAKTLLLSPSDAERAAKTPFFKALVDQMGPLAGIGQKIIAPKSPSVLEHLEAVGIAPEEVDYISYDHLHTQDVRGWLGDHGARGLFPNAKLLVMKAEWESAQGLLPTQAQWYCPDGISGIDPARVVLLEGDVMLGESLALVRSPGHTAGNHSFVTNTKLGVLVTSENGVGPDSYAPLESRIAGVAKYARSTGAEVVLNGNTLESSVEQYISMVMEKTIAGPSRANPDFPNMVCSSELDAYWAFPGIKPTFRFGDLDLGARLPRSTASKTTSANGRGARA